jgi:hypothetical protein
VIDPRPIMTSRDVQKCFVDQWGRRVSGWAISSFRRRASDRVSTFSPESLVPSI